MNRIRISESRVRFMDRLEVLDEIRIAEAQVARGEGITHEDAEQRLLARFRQLTPNDPDLRQESP